MARNDKEFRGKHMGKGSETHKEVPAHMMDMMKAVIRMHKGDVMHQSPFKKK